MRNMVFMPLTRPACSMFRTLSLGHRTTCRSNNPFDLSQLGYDTEDNVALKIGGGALIGDVRFDCRGKVLSDC